MELLSKLERTIGSALASAPHLPAEWRRWLGNNVWWIVIVGVVACGLAILSTIGVLLGGAAFIGGLSMYGYVPAIAVSSAALAWGVVQALVTIAFLLLQGVIFLAAIQPLKAKQRKGWELLFILLIVSGASSIVSAIMTLSATGFISGIFFGAIGFAVGAYLTFEIKAEFPIAKRKAAKKIS